MPYTEDFVRMVCRGHMQESADGVADIKYALGECEAWNISSLMPERYERFINILAERFENKFK